MLVEFEGDIKQQLQQIIMEEINKRLLPLSKRLVNSIRTDIITSIRESSVYQDGVGGLLRGDLGITEAQGRFEAIIKVIADSVHATFDIGNSSKNATVTVYAINATWSDILALGGIADYVSVNSKGIETTIPWLDWLLTYGRRILAPEYAVMYTSGRGARYSRTGIAIIRRNKQGVGWRMPDQYAGTPQNNFITRAIDDNVILFIKDMIKALEDTF
jgi:hypothetical protein